MWSCYYSLVFGLILDDKHVCFEWKKQNNLVEFQHAIISTFNQFNISQLSVTIYRIFRRSFRRLNLKLQQKDRWTKNFVKSRSIDVCLLCCLETFQSSLYSLAWTSSLVVSAHRDVTYIWLTSNTPQMTQHLPVIEHINKQVSRFPSIIQTFIIHVTDSRH